MVSRSSADRLRERAAYQRLVMELEPTMAVMLGSGHWSDLGRVASQVDRFRAAINRKAYGPRWSKRPDVDLVFGVAFPEKTETNPHLHCALRADGRASEMLLNKGPDIWRRLVPGASYHAEPIALPHRYARYITKELWSDESFDRVILVGRANLDAC